MVWSSALKKYSLTISGGGTLNADALYAQYYERYQAAIERIDKESPNRTLFNSWVICKIRLLQEGMVTAIPSLFINIVLTVINIKRGVY